MLAAFACETYIGLLERRSFGAVQMVMLDEKVFFSV